MSGKIFTGNASNIATLPKNILVGNPNNIARNVKGIYVGNSQNQAVKVWPSGGGRVPEGFQEVEYIRSIYESNSYHTGIKPNSNTRIVIDFMFTEVQFYDVRHEAGIAFTTAAPFFVPSDSVYYYQTYERGYSLSIQTNHNVSTDPNGWYYYFRVCFGFTNSEDYYDIYSYYEPRGYIYEDVMANIGNKIKNKRMTVDLNRSRGTLYIDNEYKTTFEHTFSNTGNEIYLLAYDPKNSPVVSKHSAVNNKINL